MQSNHPCALYPRPEGQGFTAQVINLAHLDDATTLQFFKTLWEGQYYAYHYNSVKSELETCKSLLKENNIPEPFPGTSF